MYMISAISLNLNPCRYGEEEERGEAQAGDTTMRASSTTAASGMEILEIRVEFFKLSAGQQVPSLSPRLEALGEGDAVDLPDESQHVLVAPRGADAEIVRLRRSKQANGSEKREIEKVLRVAESLSEHDARSRLTFCSRGAATQQVPCAQ